MLPCFVLTEHGGLGFGSSMHRCPTLDDASMSSQNMEDWDQAELERVVKEKHSKEKPPNATNIICKYFLEAVETKKYGWSPHTNPSPFDHGMIGRLCAGATLSNTRSHEEYLLQGFIDRL
eukprot:scaffold179106_cov19-Tisochrysis_lutea.AAC.1